jgi:prephenate dehydrogenase
MTVGIVGYGNFGRFLKIILECFAPEVVIRIYSQGASADGKAYFSLEEVAKSDAVVLTVPIKAYEGVLKKLLPHLGEQTVLVDIATVKMHTLRLLQRSAKGRRYISAHPMFGPETYEKRKGDVSGLRIIVCKHTLEEGEFKALRTILEKIGFSIVMMTAEKHDRHLAETLFLTHFIGQVVSRAKFDRTEIDTVSFGYLMDAVESVKHDKKLFEDVYKYNPYCKDVLKRLARAEKTVEKMISPRR